MIPRYTRPLMAKLWSEEEKLKVWLLVEFYAMEAWYKLGKCQKKITRYLKKN